MQEPVKICPLEFPQHYIAGGVYVKELWMRHLGEKVQGHAHTYDHLSLLARGQVMVTVDGVTTVYTAPTAVTIKAGLEHEIAALTSDCLWYCVHAVPEGLRTEEELDAAVTGGKPKSAQITTP